MTSSELSSPHADSPSIQDIPRLDRTRAVLKTLLALAVLLPIIFVLWYAWSSYTETRKQVELDVQRMVGVAEEHALKVMEINEQINARVVELLRDQSNDEIRAQQAQYHQMLNEIGEAMPQIQSINVFDETGTRMVSSLNQPNTPQPNIADREDFYHHASNPGSEVFVSTLFQGRASKMLIFNMSIARRQGERFAGVVNTSLNPGYFSEYYRQMISGNEGAAIALHHARGSLLGRYPPVSNPITFSPNAELGDRFAAGERAGSLETRSNADGKKRSFAFRRVGDLPLYIVASYSTATWQGAWYRQIGSVAAFTFLPSIALWALLVSTLRRLRREEEVWDQWRAEVTQRQAMELAYKQARRLEALGQLTGGVAHDFNNLLMVVSTSTMVLRRQMLDPKSDQPLGALERSIEAGKRLTRQLLAFSRKQPLRPEVLDVAKHVREFMELVRTSLGGRIQLDIQISPSLKPIYADEAELELALLNLALNARDAMPDGGRLRIRVDPVPADANHPERIVIAFEDTGHGIEPENLNRIFEPFFTTKAAGRGTGLGLAQVRGFCEEAGGSVGVQSIVGAGTTVTMLLPVSQSELAAPAPVETQSIILASGRVLLVEDNPEVADATRLLLEQLGYDVEIELSAEEALKRLEKDIDWVLVVSDVLMPQGISGIGLAQALHASDLQLPILLITGYTAQLEQAKTAGMRVLGKPFDAIALRKAIDEVLAAPRR
ncbi:MAG TPA: ATP-binding protein [Burkholderiales bacterium]|nr:ATP-binding protein [Burkholderiales bacterium]